MWHKKSPDTLSTANNEASRGEILSWACYDIANATYGTVVATAVYNAYFVDIIAGGTSGEHGAGTILLTAVICVSSLLVVLSAPVIGTICDATASKKKMLAASTWLCIAATTALAFIGPGSVVQSMIVLTISSIAFGTGENLIAAFLPEISSQNDMGRISSLGWAAGYLGGLVSLSGCLVYMSLAKSHGQVSTQFVPGTLILCAAVFAIASTPTFIFLRERAHADVTAPKQNFMVLGFTRVWRTFRHARHYEDLFNFLVTLFFYSCGTTTVIHLASVYAQQVLHFSPAESVGMVLFVNITAAIGALIFGKVQDKAGSVKTLAITLSIWTIAIMVAGAAQTHAQLFLASSLVGIAMGASGSVGRALVGQFSPPEQCGEFLGLWGMSVKLATACGAIMFGTVSYCTHNNYRLALLSTVLFFITGILLLLRVDEKRGRLAAHQEIPPDPPGSGG